jgi:hypothetical protein
MQHNVHNVHNVHNTICRRKCNPVCARHNVQKKNATLFVHNTMCKRKMLYHEDREMCFPQRAYCAMHKKKMSVLLSSAHTLCSVFKWNVLARSHSRTTQYMIYMKKRVCFHLCTLQGAKRQQCALSSHINISNTRNPVSLRLRHEQWFEITHTLNKCTPTLPSATHTHTK